MKTLILGLHLSLNAHLAQAGVATAMVTLGDKLELLDVSMRT